MLSFELLRCLKEIRERCNVQGWSKDFENCEDYEPVHPFVADIAEELLEKLHWRLEPHVTPANTGEIDIVWSPYNHNALQPGGRSLFVVISRTSVEIETYPPPEGKRIEYYFRYPLSIPGAADELREIVQPLLD